MRESLLYALGTGFYAVLTAHAWLRPAMVCYDTIPYTHVPRKYGPQIVLLLALLCHGMVLHNTIFRQDSLIFGFAYALSAMLWLGVGMYWLESFFLPLSGLGLFLLPSALGAMLLPLIAVGSPVLANPASVLFKVHFVIANMAYGMLALAAFHALLMLLIERRLHGLGRNGGVVWLSRWLDTMPPLLAMERLLFKKIAVGFVLLSLTIASGVWFSESFLGLLQINHKALFALISWCMFGAILLGRRCFGWRGRTALRWVLASFGALLLAYVGSHFVLEILLRRV